MIMSKSQRFCGVSLGLTLLRGTSERVKLNVGSVPFTGVNFLLRFASDDDDDDAVGVKSG